MAAIIDSAPDCVTRNEGGENFAEDGADFILQDNYADCTGFGTFMPGSTYGEEGSGAESIYMIVTWLGIVTTLAVLAFWVIYENRQLVRHVARLGGARTAAAADVPPQPGGMGDQR